MDLVLFFIEYKIHYIKRLEVQKYLQTYQNSTIISLQIYFSHKIRRQLFGSGSSLQSFFLHYFCCPRSRTFLLLEEIHYVFAWRCFPLLGLELKFFGVNAWVLFLIRLAVQVQAISCKPLSPGWAPALN